MTGFHFRLDKVLEWRRKQLELEENNFRRQQAIVADLDRKRDQLKASETAAETQVRAWNPVDGGELDALGSFRFYVKAQEMEMAVPRAEAQRRLAAQQAVMLEARRRLRLLERLKERRLAEWKEANNKELEELASESYLAQWNHRS
jgi:hypothetical protein